MSDRDPRYSAAELARCIDHTLLRPDAQPLEVDRLCEEARAYGFAAVCVNSLWIGRVAHALRDATPVPCAVVGFPLGASLPAAVAAEARAAIEAGAREIDMVMSIGQALAGDWAAVRSGIVAVHSACGDVPLKVILETCLLDDETKRQACGICRDAGVALVKTSTGFSRTGATEHDVRLLRAAVGPDIGVKASGGIRDRATAIAMLEAGATRLGCSASVAIVGGDVPADSDYS